MAINMAGIRNVIKYIQEAEPTDQNKGDVWMDPSRYAAYSWNGTGWIKVTWRPSQGGWEFGYSAGGSNTEWQSVDYIERLEFPFDSGTTIHVGNLSTSLHSDALGGCNSSNYGYIMGKGVLNVQSVVERITFPFNSGTSVHTGDLTGARGGMAGCNSTNYGYSMAGYVDILSRTSTVDRITFPFDSGEATHAGSTYSEFFHFGSCNSSNYGYTLGAEFEVWVRRRYITRLTFPFDPTSTTDLIGNLSATRGRNTGCNSSNYGYSLGGDDFTGSTKVSIIDRILFPFDSGTAVHRGNLSQIKTVFGSCNSTNYGYCMGGYTTDEISTIDRLDFPFNSGPAVHRGNLNSTISVNVGIDGTDFVTLF